jgi:hypothetical protein
MKSPFSDDAALIFVDIPRAYLNFQIREKFRANRELHLNEIANFFRHNVS